MGWDYFVQCKWVVVVVVEVVVLLLLTITKTDVPCFVFSVSNHQDDIWSQFKSFYAREDTFSLGVCNGCQLMALLGWIPEGKTLKSTDKDAAR